MKELSRRSFVGIGAGAGAGLIVPRAGGAVDFITAPQAPKDASPLPASPEVGAVEDLMREHGVLRRVLLVYSEFARAVRDGRQIGGVEQIARAAEMFRTFGEDYHAKALEEAYVFPAVRDTNTEAARYVETLIAQHERGRQITDIVLDATRGKTGANETKLAGLLESFVRMYEAHAAREDTVVFVEWKKAMTREQLERMSDTFEEIEHERFGEDGFEKMVNRVTDIERTLGLYDLSQYTAEPIMI